MADAPDGGEAAGTIPFAELLTRLGFGTNYRSKYDHVSVCYQSVGGHFTGEVREWYVAPRLVEYLVENLSGWDLWFSVDRRWTRGR
jgi:hypothetical protein